MGWHWEQTMAPHLALQKALSWEQHLVLMTVLNWAQSWEQRWELHWALRTVLPMG